MEKILREENEIDFSFVFFQFLKIKLQSRITGFWSGYNTQLKENPDPQPDTWIDTVSNQRQEAKNKLPNREMD